VPEGDAAHGRNEHAHLSGSSASGASTSASRSAARKGSKGSPHIMHSAAPSGTGSRQRGQRSVSSWSLCLRRKNRILSPVGSWSGNRDPLGYGRARPCIKDPIEARLDGPWRGGTAGKCASRTSVPHRLRAKACLPLPPPGRDGLSPERRRRHRCRRTERPAASRVQARPTRAVRDRAQGRCCSRSAVAAVEDRTRGPRP
jgi:hypothetical protein